MSLFLLSLGFEIPIFFSVQSIPTYSLTSQIKSWQSHDYWVKWGQQLEKALKLSSLSRMSSIKMVFALHHILNNVKPNSNGNCMSWFLACLCFSLVMEGWFKLTVGRSHCLLWVLRCFLCHVLCCSIGNPQAGGSTSALSASQFSPLDYFGNYFLHYVIVSRE
jgi:hypothetical protein